MVTFWNSLTLYLLLEFFEFSIVRSVSTSTIHIVPGDEVLFNCSEYSSITFKNISVQNTGKCESRQADCYLNRNDHELIKRCEGYPSCFVNGSLLTSSCLWEDLYFDLSYICKAASYEYTGCYVDDRERVLNESHKDNQAMSADICFEICTEYQTSDKYEYFGTQYGHECFCGDGQQLNSYHYNKLKESECSMPCLHNEDEMCGGFYRMSVYKITTKISSNHSCLKIDRENMIADCNTDQLQEKSLCVKFDIFSTVNVTDQICRNQGKEIGNQLYEFCKNTKLNGNCVYNLANLLTTDMTLLPPSKNISIMYSCKEKSLANSSTSRSSSNSQTPSIPTVIVSVLVVVIVVVLVFIILLLYRKRKIAKNLNSSENRQKHSQTDSINSSVNRTGMAGINMPAIYENISDNKIVNLEAHKQEGNYDTLSTNRKSAEHMYASTESTEPDLSQYQSLTNPPESDIHTYASTEPDSSQYQSLTNPTESDIHTYASTASIQ
ncbi:uncharacterized protein LOC143046768 [Mytilus galloprovincialis]|uniref:uncharacterized protein LOC143046768 n=1 Tax=Mytilus galloprovincialis TaxID=29158 RepID=UPI003F7B8066